MLRLPGYLALLCATFLVPGTTAAHGLTRLAIEISFADAPENQDAGAAADRAYDRLDVMVGQIVYLDLTLRPNAGADSDAGFSIERLGRNPANSTAEPMCGTEGGNLGMLDNVDGMYLVSAGHPAHYHAALEIRVGDRLTFPHQEITCSTEGYTDSGRTPLIVRGYFSIQSGSVPTAVQYRLTPANP